MLPVAAPQWLNGPDLVRSRERGITCVSAGSPFAGARNCGARLEMSRTALHRRVELFARMGGHDPAGSDRDLLTGLRIAPRGFFLLAQFEVAESGQLDLLAALQVLRISSKKRSTRSLASRLLSPDSSNRCSTRSALVTAIVLSHRRAQQSTQGASTGPRPSRCMAGKCLRRRLQNQS